MKIAQFRSSVYNLISVSDEVLERCEDYVRISEYVEVDFVERNKEDVVNDEIAVIDTQIKTVNLDAYKKTSELEQRKAELLAIPDMSNE